MEKYLPKIKTKKKKRVGRGYGSGKGGHTVGRGQKGQKSRKKIGIMFEGIKVRKSLLKRLPQLRGKKKFKGSGPSIILNLDDLNSLPSGTKVNIESLAKHSLVKESEAKKMGVKILSDGKLTKKLTVELPVSKSAERKIKKAGGKVN